MPNETVFLDAAYAIALAASDDEFHLKAVELARELRAHKRPMITTEAVILEVGDALAKPRHRPAAVQLIGALLNDRQIEVVPTTRGLMERAIELFGRRLDKGWGLTDCLSFVVMRDRGVRDALTTDELFEQAGFSALLRH